jgi:hypothetical protein
MSLNDRPFIQEQTSQLSSLQNTEHTNDTSLKDEIIYNRCPDHFIILDTYFFDTDGIFVSATERSFCTGCANQLIPLFFFFSFFFLFFLPLS